MGVKLGAINSRTCSYGGARWGARWGRVRGETGGEIGATNPNFRIVNPHKPSIANPKPTKCWRGGYIGAIHPRKCFVCTDGGWSEQIRVPWRRHLLRSFRVTSHKPEQTLNRPTTLTFIPQPWHSLCAHSLRRCRLLNLWSRPCARWGDEGSQACCVRRPLCWSQSMLVPRYICVMQSENPLIVVAVYSKRATMSRSRWFSYSHQFDVFKDCWSSWLCPLWAPAPCGHCRQVAHHTEFLYLSTHDWWNPKILWQCSPFIQHKQRFQDLDKSLILQHNWKRWLFDLAISAAPCGHCRQVLITLNLCTYIVHVRASGSGGFTNDGAGE